MKKGKFIRDSIHGDVKLNSFEVKVMDEPQFQRLRRIKQLGFIYLVYPGAQHSRFEHSIGTMHLTSKIANKLELSDDEVELVRMAALLHDIGHAPFSHASEGALSHPHEKITEYIIKKTSLRDFLSEKFDVNEINDIIQGKGKLGSIVSGELDMDRMDYLMRDSHYTGVAYGVIDIERIISNLYLNNDLYLDIKGVQAAESALVSRYFMYPSVYQHHTTRIINDMLRRSLNKLLKSKIITEKDLSVFDDSDLINTFRNSEGFVKDIGKRLDNRRLLKKVHTTRIEMFENPGKIYKITKEELNKAEEEIAMDYDMDKDYVFVNIADYPHFDEMKTQVSLDDKLYPLNEISSIVGALSRARFNIPDINVYVPEEEKYKFNRFKLENYLDLPEVNKNKFNSVHFNQMKLF